MEQIGKVFFEAIKDSGMTIKAVCEKTGIPYGRLYPSLKGNRELRVTEFLSLCKLLGIDPYFAEKEEKA